MSSDGLFPNPNGEQTSLDANGASPSVSSAQEAHEKDTPADQQPPRTGPTLTDPQELIDRLDTPQTFSGASSYQVRDEFQELVARDLLGPWGGDYEEFAPNARGPRERYLVGMLGPRDKPAASHTADAGDLADTEAGIDGTAKGEEAGELPDVVTTQNLGHIWASSMGLAFSVADDTDALSVTASWGQYSRRSLTDDDGKSRTTWVREPCSYMREVRLDGDRNQRIGLTAADTDTPGVYLDVAVRPRDGRRTVELTLINGRRQPSTTPDTAWLFQARLAVTALDGGSPVFLPIDDPLDPARPAPPQADSEELHLRLLYRNQLSYARGRNVAVLEDADPGLRRARSLETTWLPTYDVAPTSAPSGPGTPLAGTELSMDALASASPEELATGLAPLADGYSAWLDEREAEIGDLPESLRSSAEAAVFKARRTAGRIRAGIGLLSDPATPGHGDALRAFRFANRVMADQRRHTEIGRLREDPDLAYAAAERAVRERGPSAASWRPFQLAFVLLNLPSLASPSHPERAASPDALVDLLFFPTGGGKTEAYLGLTAFTFAIRRLQGIVGSGQDARSGMAGVAVLMRYTLRLLTAQQFQRAAALVCAAEVERRADPGTWGEEPFRIGLWVGAGVSPNWYTDAEEQIRNAREAGHGERTNVLQTLACPWCGAELTAQRDLVPDPVARRVRLFCPNGEGADACPFSQRASSEGLPILTVDEEIYRYTPSLVIATVDKLARLPWSGYAGMLFGRVREQCPRHGFRHDDLDRRTDCRSRHIARAGYPAAASRPVPRLRPPDLIIQDELHLISGALGTTVGLFESAVDRLCTWTAPDGARTAPKIVASTATTKRANDQVRGVFARDLQIFPPQATDVADTFFSQQVAITEKDPGRRYMGVCAHGVRLKSAEIRLAEILLIAGQTMFDKHGEAADPYMTTVGYFNATRELAGMRRYVDDDVVTRVRRNGRAKGLSNRLQGTTQLLEVQELTSRVSSGDISRVLKGLEIPFDPELDTSDRKRTIIQHGAAVLQSLRKGGSRPNQPEYHQLADRRMLRAREDRAPVDMVLATSMLQVGVDVSRFGLMMVTGQPKNTAEYIQASSRVGRDARRPGLVVTLYNWTRPRDLAHFEDFRNYHASFYREVEALSVTPFTRRSLDRGTAAAFVAAVRNLAEEYSHNADAHDVDLDGDVVEDVTRHMLERAETVGGDRGRAYLGERLKVLTDVWKRKRDGSARLGYERDSFGSTRLVELLNRPGEGPWLATTVGMSMRETENEVNLLLPGDARFLNPPIGAPEWSFAGATGDRGTDGGGTGGGTDEDGAADPEDDTDELGQSAFDKKQDREGSR
ncbi:DISARM system helicase DrmA [Nocardiopsis sp. RSe5-2]|uniref:DISARM system helicase DrmA n=1 Tax=Nocardiopsis endophytica TaxID=3018445 RepID=A0ABT4U2S5_9ACTN|nr:DISARM system helicase DrmA [Nocardiopsis endophytica]MDA2810657.1 DISARM system helicase DrmA [Nocardiopsis endophytica]